MDEDQQSRMMRGADWPPICWSYEDVDRRNCLGGLPRMIRTWPYRQWNRELLPLRMHIRFRLNLPPFVCVALLAYIRSEETFMYDHAAEEQRRLDDAQRSLPARRDGRSRRSAPKRKWQSEGAAPPPEDRFVFRVVTCMECNKTLASGRMGSNQLEYQYCNNNGCCDPDEGYDFRESAYCDECSKAAPWQGGRAKDE